MSPHPDNTAMRGNKDRRRGRMGGRTISIGSCMRWVFSTSALFTIVALSLIIFFLLKESAGFFKKYNESLISYRLSGMEFVDLMERHYREYIEISHGLVAIRSDWIESLHDRGVSEEALPSKLSQPEINSLLMGYRTNLHELREHINNRINRAIQYRGQLFATRPDRASQPPLKLGQIAGGLGEYENILDRLKRSTTELFRNAEEFDFNESSLNRRLLKLDRSNEKLQASIDSHLNQLKEWDAGEPVGRGAAIKSFFSGSAWVTASDQQNWFGLLPLISGSLLACGIALAIATPFGIGAAIYVNQVAHPRELAFIKPFIEFVSAMPTVVVGFFGVMVFGDLVREFSRLDLIQWLPFFPVQERLNAFTAGALLGVLAVPTIFTLTEEALNDVPEQLKEASYVIGATRLQTTWRTILPSALPGIVAAIMLGFGRVIGETMVVLLCAGNRVRIPEFQDGLQVLFEPVHTMTGMIAQEMGEVVYGSLHYHALFMVGVVLFGASLIINYTAKSLARRSGHDQTD